MYKKALYRAFFVEDIDIGFGVSVVGGHAPCGMQTARIHCANFRADVSHNHRLMPPLVEVRVGGWCAHDNGFFTAIATRQEFKRSGDQASVNYSPTAALNRPRSISSSMVVRSAKGKDHGIYRRLQN